MASCRWRKWIALAKSFAPARAKPDRGKAWFEEWRTLGDLIEKRGDEALAKGRKITAGDYYLRAGIYHYNAERFISPSPEKTRAVRARLQGLAPGHPAAPSRMSSSSKCPMRAPPCPLS